MQTIDQPIKDNWVRDDIKSIMLHRIALLERCNQDLDYRLLILELCRRDVVFFCDNFVFTSDPRNAARSQPISIPFMLFERQKECLVWIESCYLNRKFGLIGKSRDAGISYICTLFHLHKWLFTPDYIGLLASRKEILVDRIGDMSSLFAKVRFMLESLPAWMRPDYQDSYMKLINKANGSTLIGEAGSQTGRGGRASCAFLDEAAFLEQPDKIMAALSQTADCVIRVSTPNGSADLFATDYLSNNFPTFQLTWQDDPRKSHWVAPDGSTGSGRGAPQGAKYTWYEEQKTKLSPITIARELDVSFEGSAEGVVIKHDWVLSAINYPLVMHNDRRVAGLDPAGEGKDRSVLIIVDGGNKVILVESWQGEHSTETARKAIVICHQYNVDCLNFDVSGLGDGVAGTLKSTPGLRFQFQPINGGSSPSDRYWPAEQRTSKEKFYNRRAEIYYLAAERFFKTWENVNGINQHNTDDCITIPNDPRLIGQLSITTGKHADNGKLLLTPKSAMKISPDFADSLVYALIPPPSSGWNMGTKTVWG